MSISDDIKNQLRFITSSPALDRGVDALYYPAVTTGYSVATTTRSPHETGPVSVRGYFGKTSKAAPDGVMTTETTFTIPSSNDLSLVPVATDRFTATRDGVELNYTVTSVVTVGGGAVAAGYRLSVMQS